MNEREFCYWLQGLLELSDTKTLDEKQVQIIRDHLQLIFNKVTITYDWTTLNPPIIPTTITPPFFNPPEAICSSNQYVPPIGVVGSC